MHSGKKKKKPIKYYAPADGFENISFYELTQIFTLFEDYLQTKEEETINRLLATMYRRKKSATPEQKAKNYEGDIRRPLLNYEAAVELRLPLFRTLPRAIKQLLLFWVASCRQAIIEEYPKVFKTNGKKSDPDYRWAGVLFAMCGNDLTKIDGIGSQHHATALLHLSYLEDQRVEGEKEVMK